MVTQFQQQAGPSGSPDLAQSERYNLEPVQTPHKCQGTLGREDAEEAKSRINVTSPGKQAQGILAADLKC